MIKTELITKTTVVCDFCGKSYEPSGSYPILNGQYATFHLSLTFGFTDKITGITQIFGDDSKLLGHCKGNICNDCLRDISDKIKHCKESTNLKDAPTVLEASISPSGFCNTEGCSNTKPDMSKAQNHICPYYQGVCSLDENILCYCEHHYEMCEKFIKVIKGINK